MYSEQDGVLRPTARIAQIPGAATRTFVVEGQLLGRVVIGAAAYSEAELLEIVVGASTCLAPSWQRIVQRQEAAGFQHAPLARSRPPPGHAAMTRVVCHTPVLQVAGLKTPADHAREELARRERARFTQRRQRAPQRRVEHHLLARARHITQVVRVDDIAARVNIYADAEAHARLAARRQRAAPAGLDAVAEVI